MKSILVYILFVGTAFSVFISCTSVSDKMEPTGIPEMYRGFEEVVFPSSEYSHSQKAIYRQSNKSLRPLIVSLHTWGGDYLQEDSIAVMAKTKDWNYIHPDYGGRQWTEHSCCFPESVQDIDDAISYAIERGNVDTTKIVIIGKSGGGSGVLAAYLKSEFSNAFYFSWSPIPDYISWYHEVQKDSALASRYLNKILLGTQSVDSLNVEMAKKKSPSHFSFAPDSVARKLVIYIGIRDGLDGWSTSITQGIGFYNKALTSMSVTDSSLFVSSKEMKFLMKNRSSIKKYEESVGKRSTVHKEKHGPVSLVIFEGGHEIIYEQVASDLTFEYHP